MKNQFEVGEKYFIPATEYHIEIIKDYGCSTPMKDYPAMWRVELNGYVEAKNLDTDERFPIARRVLEENKLVKIT